jgi:FkbM family methyltransferase
MTFKYKGNEYSITGRKEKHFREIEIMELISSYKLKNSMIDCGANYGNHTVYFASNTELQKIFSFEPMPEIYPMLLKNVKDNKIEHKVECFNYAVGNKEKELNLISEIPETQGAFWFWYKDEKATHPKDMGYYEHRKGTNKTIIVKSIRIDDFLKTDDKIDFMKIDVEGMELEVLKGAAKLIDTHRPLLYVEVCKGTKNLMECWILNNSYKKVKNKCLFGHHWLLEPR